MYTTKPISDFTALNIASQRYVKSGDVVTLTKVITNTGNTTLNSVSITDTLDSNLDYQGSANLYVNNIYVAPDINVSSLPTTVLSFPTGTNLLPGQSAVFTFKVKVKEGIAPNTIIKNKSTVISKDPDNTNVGPKDTNEVQLLTKSLELEVVKIAPETVRCRDSLTYTITVKNKSTELDATNVVVTDYFDPEFTFTLNDVAVPATATKDLISPNGIKVTIPSIPADGTATVTIVGVVNCCGPN